MIIETINWQGQQPGPGAQDVLVVSDLFCSPFKLKLHSSCTGISRSLQVLTVILNRDVGRTLFLPLYGAIQMTHWSISFRLSQNIRDMEQEYIYLPIYVCSQLGATYLQHSKVAYILSVGTFLDSLIRSTIIRLQNLSLRPHLSPHAASMSTLAFVWA